MARCWRYLDMKMQDWYSKLVGIRSPCAKDILFKDRCFATLGAYPGQTGLTIIDIDMTSRTIASAIDLLRLKLVVRKLVVGYLHYPWRVERSGECKQEGFKSNPVIVKSGMEVRILSRIEWHDRYTISPLKARKDWCASGSLFQCSFGLWEMFLGMQPLPRNRGAYVDTKNWQIARFAMQSRRTGETGCINRSDRSG